MLVVDHVVSVNEEKCIGCKACDRVCPTAAIVTVDRLARVDESLCVGCNKCIEACFDHGAIARKFLDENILLGGGETAVPEQEIVAFCAKARLAPDDAICPCTGTTAREVAVALLEGATSAEEVTMRTGIRGVCSMWCTTPLIRMMGLAGLEQPSDPKNWRLYPDGVDSNISIWGISEDIVRRYPEYRLAEARAALKERAMEVPMFPAIQKDPE